MQYELAPLGVAVKIVEPGFIATNFGGRSFDFVNDESMPEYRSTVAGTMAGFAGGGEPSAPSVVADVIWQAATDGTSTLRYRAGDDAAAALDARKGTDDDTFFAGIRSRMGLN